MILQRLSVINYKNIVEATLDFSSKMNCFIGHNGAGKTNVLDAIYYLSFCRSAFTAVDSQVLRHEQGFFVLDGKFVNESGEEENIYCGMKRGVRKHFKRNKKEYKRLSQHIGFIPLIMISPADNYLIEGSSEERRKLMDVVIAQYDHTYIDALSNYNKALQQRNSLLKMDSEPDIELLKIWEEQMAENGEKVYHKRNDFVQKIKPVFEHFYQNIAQNREHVSLEYVSHCQRGDLLEIIQRDRYKDRAVGYSLHGVHRDDLEMFLGSHAMKREGSQGQNKTFVIALKLAQFDLLKRCGNKVVPILLLDDIFDKLDSERVEQIIRLVSSDEFGQIFITDTNRDHLDKILSHGTTDYKLFNVKKGEIIER